MTEEGSGHVDGDSCVLCGAKETTNSSIRH